MSPHELKALIELLSRDAFGDSAALASLYHSLTGVCMASPECQTQTAHVLTDAVLGPGHFNDAAFPQLLGLLLQKRKAAT